MMYWSNDCSLTVNADNVTSVRKMTEIYDEFIYEREVEYSRRSNQPLSFRPTDIKLLDAKYLETFLHFWGFPDARIDENYNLIFGNLQEGDDIMLDYLRFISKYVNGDIYLYDDNDNDNWAYKFEDEEMRVYYAELVYKDAEVSYPFPQPLMDFLDYIDEEKAV